MKKILCLFDHFARTGYGIVSEQLVAHLTNHFGASLGLHIIATNYFGEPVEVLLDGNIRTVYVESAKLSQDPERTPEHLELDDFGRMVFLERLVQMDFDGIFIMQDLGIITPMIPLLKDMKEGKAKANKKQFKSVFYFPVDCQLPVKYFEGIEFFDLLVTYTEYARKQVLAYNQSLKPKTMVIPHGVSGTDYHVINMPEILKFRKDYFSDAEDELFIIGAINRNQPRKDIPATIFGFVEAKKKWIWSKKPFLYLHMDPKDAKGWDLPFLLNQCGLVEGVDYMFPKTDDVHFQVDVETMNKIYNSNDLYISTSRGEGWGLTATEAMAVGTLCILPCHTSYIEIGQNSRCIFLEELVPVCGFDDNTIRNACFHIEVGEKIIECFENIDEKDIHQIKARAYEYMRNLRWNTVCKKWIEVFKEVF